MDVKSMGHKWSISKLNRRLVVSAEKSTNEAQVKVCLYTPEAEGNIQITYWHPHH